MKEITVEEVLELRSKFLRYCDTAEQHQFLMLFVIHTDLDATIAEMQAAGAVTDQKEARVMFRTILRVIGEDYTDYLEKPTGEE